MSEQVIQRTHRLAKFLRAAVAIKTRPVAEVNKYPHVLWFHGMPTDLDEVRSPLLSTEWPDDNFDWLVVRRVVEPVRPEVPADCRAWLVDVPLDEPARPPTVNRVRSHHDPATDEVVEVPVPESVDLAFDAYLTQQWAPWAEKAKVARAVSPIYRRLFAAYQELRGKDDAYDVFLGLGLLDSRVDAAQPLHRHLLAFPAEIQLEEKSGTISVGPSPESVGPRAEVDFLSPVDRGRVESVADNRRGDIEALWPRVQERPEVRDVLAAFAHQLHANAEYSGDLKDSAVGRDRIRVTFAPAVVIRPRTARSLDELLAKIESDTQQSDPRLDASDLPVAWRRMVEDGDSWSDSGAGASGGSAAGADGRVYFPLAFNDEQLKIVKHATGTAGVVVQGPPGTGKSHTIANLISHYLASGQRVLVTAQTAQALEVLRDKMPPELQDLCVCLLGNSRRSDKDLQRSVKGILARRQDAESTDYPSTVAALRSALEHAEAWLASLERTLSDARAGETIQLEPLPGYKGTRARLADRVNREAPERGWISDQFASDSQCPSYQFGWSALADYHEGLDEEKRRALAKTFLELPFDPRHAIDLVARIRRLKARKRLVVSGVPVPELPDQFDTEPLAGVADWLTRLADAESGRPPTEWATLLRRELMAADRVRWKTLAAEASEALAALPQQTVEAIVPVEVEGRSRGEALRALTELATHYEAGGKRRKLLMLKPRVVKTCDWVETAVRVSETPARAPEDVERARRALDGWQRLDAAWQVWAPWNDESRGSPKQQVAALKSRLDHLQSLIRLAQDGELFPAPVHRWLRERLLEGHSTAALQEAVQGRLAALELVTLRRERDALAFQLDKAINGRDVVPAIAAFLAGLLHESDEQLSAARDELASERTRREHHKHYTDFIDGVDRYAPLLGRAIRDGEGDACWGERFKAFETAWTHRRAATWLREVLDGDRIASTERAARDQRQRVQELLGSLTAALAWQAALKRITDIRRASLVAWTNAVAAIPKTGLSVFRKRATARSYLSGCLDCVPAWVVSLGRLYETVDARPGLFDVAIIDEASQCWLDSLILFYLAKQVIIVGDDKQISPTVVGVGDSQVAELANTYLPDFDFRGSFTIESSLFDHAQRYFSGSVPLREHFRCVPEIIRFSNELCYSDRPLIPLRSVGSDRLEPLKRKYLPDGIRRGDVNELEAAEIVNAIKLCDADPAYEEADFGVICLQGDAQARRVEQEIIDRIGPGVFAKRNLRCGNPYAFQGDERDVMFLSMVAAPNAQNASLTARMFEQRFNVALSRARDQVWLFHSIEESDLGPNCLRRRVLEFFRQPPDLTIAGVRPDIPRLQLQAARADRSIERPPRPFDSWFEVDVALALAARGFRLSAQVEVGPKKIDLVIEGEDGARLAVECDGDAWHGPEQYEQDVFRQRQLERVGWRFVRVRESVFRAMPDRALEEVRLGAEEVGIGVPGKPRRAGEPPADDATLVETIVHGPPPDVPSALPGSEIAVEVDDSEEEAEEFDPGLTASYETLSFAGYGGKDYPDPRTAPPTNVRDAVLDIVTSDGPLTRRAVYRLYREGCPRIAGVGKVVRRAIDSALRYLERQGLLDVRDEGGRRNPAEVAVKAAGQAWARVRPLGARQLEDIPLSEVAAAAETAAPGWTNQEPALRAELLKDIVRRGYGVQRIRQATADRLSAVDRFATSVRIRPDLHLFPDADPANPD